MKKIYQQPYVRVVALKNDDVISTSNEGYDDGDTSGWFDNESTNP